MKLFFSNGKDVGNVDTLADSGIPSFVESGGFTSDLFVDFENGGGRELFMTKSRLTEMFFFYTKARRHPFFFSDMAVELWSQAEKLELERFAQKSRKRKKPKTTRL